ncbi:type II secretion system minor pseudopilin GspK [Duganella sp. CT11-72]|uniref:type II secretion system minor pseudopilin GspK n=1 Tax=Duganella sp. CT11-72 TaxID=3243052 RepID=UPI0039B0AEA5
MPAPGWGRQRGVAVVTALLLTALSVTLVTGIFWQQQILVRGMEGQRLHLQGKLIARAAVDPARLTLLEAASQDNVTTLDGGWTAPLLEDRLDRFLGQGPEQGLEQGWEQGGRLAQHIVDAQGCFNLRNLAGANGIDLFQVTAFSRLLAALKLDAGLAFRIGEAIVKSQREMEIRQLDDLLAVPGMSADAIERLRDFVVVLPVPTPVNVNTASAEVLTSVVNFSLQDARALIARRSQAHFKGPSDFAFRLNDKETLEGVNYQVSSDYFLVHSTLTLARATLRTQALIRRSGDAALVWMRED